MKNLTLNLNSWHFKVYSYFYGNKPPMTLCPYFWKLIALFTFSPIILPILTLYYVVYGVAFIIQIIRNWVKTKKNKTTLIVNFNPTSKKIGTFLDYILNGVIFSWRYIFLPVVVIITLYLIIINSTMVGWITALFTMILVVSAIGAIVLIVYIFRSEFMINVLFHIAKPFKIIWTMIVAWYKKACPLITWEKR